MSTETNVLNAIMPVIYELYIPGIQKYTESEDFYTNQVKANQKIEQVGDNFTVKVQLTNSEGISMSGGVTAALPTYGQVRFTEYKGTTKSIEARIRVWRKLMDWTQSTKEAALKYLDAELNGIQEAAKCEIERMGIADAGATPIACVASAVVTNETDTWVTVTIDNGGPSVNALCGTRWPVRYFRAGMKIDILAADHTSVSGTSTESLEILSISGSDIIKIKCDTNAEADALAALLADGQLIYHQDGYNSEYEGVKSMFGATDNKLFGSDDADRTTTTNEFLIPFVQRVNSSGLIESGTATGTNYDWSILNLVEFLDHLQIVNKAKASDLVMLCEKNILNRYIAMKKAEGMYVLESATIDGWPFQTVSCEGIRMTCPPYMFSNAISVVPIKKITKYLCREFDFVTEFDNNTFQKVPGYDAADAYMVGTWQYGCENFQHGGTLYDLKGAYDS